MAKEAHKWQLADKAADLEIPTKLTQLTASMYKQLLLDCWEARA